MKSPDNDDVAVLDIVVNPEITTTIMKKQKRYTNLLASAYTPGPDALCKAMIECHMFSGCDSTSPFIGHGKAKGQKRERNDQGFRNSVQQLGRSFVD